MPIYNYKCNTCGEIYSVCFSDKINEISLCPVEDCRGIGKIVVGNLDCELDDSFIYAFEGKKLDLIEMAICLLGTERSVLH